MNNNEVFWNIFKNKKVIVTGHTGFKGSWLSIWLHTLGEKYLGYQNQFLLFPQILMLVGWIINVLTIGANICNLEDIKKIIK